MDDCTREGYVEIKIAFDDHPDISKPWACGHILYIAEALGSQKCLDYIEWSETDSHLLLQTDRGRFRWALGGERYPSANEASGRGQRRATQEMAAICMKGLLNP